MKNKSVESSLSINSHNLTGNQSVRTTFKIHENSLKAMDWLQSKYQIKSKDLFDFICSDDLMVPQLLNPLKDKYENRSGHFIRKTYVISKKTKHKLNKASYSINIKRDTVVNILIDFCKIYLENTEEKEIEAEKNVQVILNEYERITLDTERKLKELLSKDNPILYRFNSIALSVENLAGAVKYKIEDGVPIDPDEL